MYDTGRCSRLVSRPARKLAGRKSGMGKSRQRKPDFPRWTEIWLWICFSWNRQKWVEFFFVLKANFTKNLKGLKKRSS